MLLSKGSLNLSANLGRVKQGDPDRVVLGRYCSPLPPTINVSTEATTLSTLPDLEHGGGRRDWEQN